MLGNAYVVQKCQDCQSWGAPNAKRKKQNVIRYLKSQETGFVHSGSVTTSRQGVNMNDIAAK